MSRLIAPYTQLNKPVDFPNNRKAIRTIRGLPDMMSASEGGHQKADIGREVA